MRTRSTSPQPAKWLFERKLSMLTRNMTVF